MVQTESQRSPQRALPATEPEAPWYYDYYGVKWNAVGIQEFYSRAMETQLKWLNRRANAGVSTGMASTVCSNISKSHVLDSPISRDSGPALAFWLRRDAAECFTALKPDPEASISEEPGARKPHAGICAGAIG